ncbi:MAG: Hsp20/alpha crystallin family protein [Leptospira sp.]|jgi:HSP20 family protein|nr:Hsp20/alpha crystallin family protein [Leptospira sp.]
MNTTTNELKVNEQSARTQNEKGETKVYSPNVNIFESKDHLKLVLEMPGVDQSSVQLNVEKDVLSIEARFDLDFSNLGKPGLVEFRGGIYERKFTLGKAVDAEQASAKMKNGMLELTLPKVEPKKTKIEIQS